MTDPSTKDFLTDLLAIVPDSFKYYVGTAISIVTLVSSALVAWDKFRREIKK